MIKITSKRTFSVLLIGLAISHLGAIRRDEDPILNAQTGPISLKQKLEETKDGVKGAPAPSFKYYDKEDFLTRSPMRTEAEALPPDPSDEYEIAPFNEVEIPEIGISEESLEDEIPEETESDDDWWMEDQA